MQKKVNIYSEKERQLIINPILNKIKSLREKGQTVIIGLQGGQGTGKSTLSSFLKEELKKEGYRVQAFSIDDFYKTNAERQKLREKYKNNPFYQISRGLPGTHRIDFLLNTLKLIKAGKNFEIPVFDKSLHNAQGDVLKKTIKVKERQDFIFFEGWCVGISYTSAQELKKICEKNKIGLNKIDPSLKHSKVILDFVKKYEPLWKFIDLMVMMKPSSVELHKKWRFQAEKELKKKKGKGMDEKGVNHFVDIFLPFTYLCYEKMKADLTILIDEKHDFYALILPKRI